MATVTAAVTESTGTRRAVVKSERFMEWQRELSSSRAIHSGRKRHEDSEIETVNGMKKTYCKSEEDGAEPQCEQESDEREAEGEEPAAGSVVGEGNGASHRMKRQKQLHQRQRSDVKKFRKEHEGDQRRVAIEQSKETSPTPTEGDAGRMRRCKQQSSLPLQACYPKRQAHPVTPVQQQPEASLSQPISRRRQRRVPQSTSPPKDVKDIERVLRSLTRTRGGETPPPAPSVPAGKGTKRSKRVAQRLANEEPPPLPLKLPKLHLVLTRKEIQEDWVKITGHKYSGKPKKSTIVQRGLGLCTSLTCPSSIRYLNEPQYFSPPLVPTHGWTFTCYRELETSVLVACVDQIATAPITLIDNAGSSSSEGILQMCLFVNGDLSTSDSPFDGQVSQLENLDTHSLIDYIITYASSAST